MPRTYTRSIGPRNRRRTPEEMAAARLARDTAIANQRFAFMSGTGAVPRLGRIRRTAEEMAAIRAARNAKIAEQRFAFATGTGKVPTLGLIRKPRRSAAEMAALRAQGLIKPRKVYRRLTPQERVQKETQRILKSIAKEQAFVLREQDRIARGLTPYASRKKPTRFIGPLSQEELQKRAIRNEKARAKRSGLSLQALGDQYPLPPDLVARTAPRRRVVLKKYDTMGRAIPIANQGF